MHQKLNPTEINSELKQLHLWTVDDEGLNIYKAWKFVSFKHAMNFLSKVGDLAEEQDHHPEFLATYTNVRIRLTTHDAQGLTHKDFELARSIDQLISHAFSDLLNPN